MILISAQLDVFLQARHARRRDSVEAQPQETPPAARGEGARGAVAGEREERSARKMVPVSSGAVLAPVAVLAAGAMLAESGVCSNLRETDSAPWGALKQCGSRAWCRQSNESGDVQSLVTSHFALYFKSDLKWRPREQARRSRSILNPAVVGL